MDFKLGRINLNAVAQGVGGLVFGSDNSANEDSYVERYLDRISNGVLADDRRVAMAELQSLVAESQSAQLAFGAMGFPILLAVLREERDDIELVRGAIEALVSALTPIETSRGLKNGVQPASMNSDQFSRESGSISLLLSLLSEEDFYVRYYTLQMLTTLLTHSPNRLQEAILSIPRGITRLMDMLMDREVIRNEALLLLTHLTREAEEIQKIVVFEGAFEKIFSIIREEGGSDGGLVVQDCLDLLNNLIRNNASNQILLKETIGFEPLVSILKLHRGTAYNFTQQKTINLLSAMETIGLLLKGGPENDPGTGKDSNRLSNQTALAQKKVLDHLLMLGVESQWASVSVRCLALRCIGELVIKNPQNLDTLTGKSVGEEPHVEPSLNAILRISLRTTAIQEFVAADYAIKCFCEKNTDGQAMLVSTMIPPPYSSSRATVEDDAKVSFGSMLLRALVSPNGDPETCGRAACVLSHLLKDNVHCKERVLQVQLEGPIPSLGTMEPLLHRTVKCLAVAAPTRFKDNDQNAPTPSGDSYIQQMILRLLATWLADCPNAVQCLLDSSAHLSYLLDLVLNPHVDLYVRGLSTFVLGQCVIYNKSSESNKDAFSIVDAISQKIGLNSYFLNFEDLWKVLDSLSSGLVKHHMTPLTRSSTASMVDMEDAESEGMKRELELTILVAVFDLSFIAFLKNLEVDIRESIVGVFSHTKNKVAVVPAELEQTDAEIDGDYIRRLKSFVEKQCHEMQDLLVRNATIAEELVRTGGGEATDPAHRPSGGGDGVQSETIRRDLQAAMLRVEMLKSEKAKAESEASNYRNLAAKLEADMKSLSDAYNSLEQDNFRMESEVRKGEIAQSTDLEAIRVEAREEALKESEVELNDLLVCLGQEQSKVEKLSARLAELGEDVDALLEGIGDDAGIEEDEDEDGDDDEDDDNK